MPTTKEHLRNSADLADSERDKQRMQPEHTTIEMPDVADIPGQEHIHVPKMKSFHDTTISSDGEEGKSVFKDDMLDTETDVTEQEKELLSRTEDSMASIDDEERRSLMLDSRDLDGDLLNEKDDVSGDDLDVPGTAEDDGNQQMGEEDEENTSYSLGGDRKD